MKVKTNKRIRKRLLVEDYLEILSLTFNMILLMNIVIKPYYFPYLTLPLSPNPLRFDKKMDEKWMDYKAYIYNSI
jgi:hypothetical protein